MLLLCSSASLPQRYRSAPRAGKKVLLDSKNMKISNAADATKYLYREYRKGWEL
jgi:hypothetical protein